MPITFGSDPEFMLQDEQGRLKSAIGVVFGTKDDRYDMGDDHLAFYDNVLAECNIRPEASREAVVGSFRECIERYAQLVRPLRLVPQASAYYPDGECEHRDARLFGCDPEFCAYEMMVVVPPDCRNTFRSGGGHIHIGYDGGVDFEKPQAMGEEEYEELIFQICWDRVWVVRMCDLFLGIPSLLLDKDPTSKDRRRLYGKAGTHRACEKYGVEYRSLGNFWLARPSLVELMYDLATVATKVVMEDRVHEKIWEEDIDPDELRRTIDDAAVGETDKFMDVIGRYVEQNVIWRIGHEASKDYAPNLDQWK